MNWREPWRAPKVHQMATFVLAGCLGLLLVSPALIDGWARWESLVVLEDKMQAQQHMTASLKSQTAQLQRSMPTAAFTWIDAPALMALAPSSALQFSRVHHEAHVPTPYLNAQHVQLVPMRFELQSSWTGWLNWLEQWSLSAPGVTLSTLAIKTNPQGVLAVQMVAVAAQRVGTGVANDDTSTGAPLEQMAGDLFDMQRWVSAKSRHAQAHPSYKQQVAPELFRPQEPLERYAHEHLHYVGQISSGVDVQALIRVHDPEAPKFAEVHRVRVGSHAGQNFGRVSAIGAEYLMLDELLLSSGGEWHRQELRMPLQERMP